MSDVLDRVEKLRRELAEHERQIGDLSRQRLARLTLLCKRGIVPEAEALELFEQHVEHATSQGRKQFRNGIDGFLRPAHQSRNEQNPSGGIRSLSGILGFTFTHPGRGVGDSPEVLAFLLKDQILDAGRTLIREACQEAKEAGNQVPDRETREREIQALDDEIDQLRADHDQVKRDAQSLREARRPVENVRGPRVTFPDDETESDAQAAPEGQ